MWEDIYAELMNKIRWAISSTVAQHSNMSYRESQACARPFARIIADGLKLQSEAPDFSISAYTDQQTSSKRLDTIEV